MAEQDVMRLAAEIVDKYSGPLKAMQKALRETSDIARGAHTAGAKSTSQHEKAYRDLYTTMGKVRTSIASGLTPTMATLGVTTFSVSTAIAGVVASVKKLGDSYYQLQDASKRAGLSARNIDALTVAFENLGIAPDAARSGVSNLGELLDKTSRRVPDAIDRWNKLGGAWQLLGSQLQGLSRADQLAKITEFLSVHPMSVDQRRKFWSDVLAAPELVPLATKSGEQIRAALARGAQFEREHPYNPKLAGQLNDTFNELRTTLQGVERDMGNAFGGPTARLIKDFAASIAAISGDLSKVGAFLEKWGTKFGVGGYGKYSSMQEYEAARDKRVAEGLKQRDDAIAKIKGLFGGAGAADESALPPNARPRMYSPADSEKSIKKGTLDALREWWNSISGSPFGGGNTGGILFRRGIRGGGGGGNVQEPNLEGLTGNEYLKAQRARFAEEFAKNPDEKLRAAAITSLENEGARTGVMESLFNRMSLIHQTAAYGMRGGPNSFYGPGRHPGMIEARMRAIANNPKWRARLDAYTDAALAGSDLIKSNTDQGSLGDPNYFAGGKGENINGERFNDWGIPGSRAWRLENERRVNAAPSSPTIWDSGTKPLDLLKLGKQSGLFGGPQTFKSAAALQIDVNAPPGSIKTRLAHSGFEDVQFNRGLQMANASQSG